KGHINSQIGRANELVGRSAQELATPGELNKAAGTIDEFRTRGGGEERFTPGTSGGPMGVDRSAIPPTTSLPKYQEKGWGYRVGAPVAAALPVGVFSGSEWVYGAHAKQDAIDRANALDHDIRTNGFTQSK